jgi:thiol-disulfide isomerase/thioredoxin
VLAVVALLALAACSGPESEVALNQPTEQTPSPRATSSERTLPDIVLPKLYDGGNVRLSEISGRPTVINAWATWCAPCRRELPLLGRAAREYQGRVDFLGVDVADDKDAALAMVKSTGATFPHVVDLESKTRVSLAYTGGLPTTVFVDAQGRIVGEERTWFRSYADVTAAIRRHLRVAP